MTNNHCEIIVKGGVNQLAFDGQSVSQNNYPRKLSRPRRRKYSALQVQSFVTHDDIGVATMLLKAKQHIVLHAAYYPKYGNAELESCLYQILYNNKDLTLTVIFTETSNVSWLEEFAKVLHPYYDAEEFTARLQHSCHNFNHLQKEIGTERVRIVSTSRLPLFPVILIDNTIIVGHYAHSSTPTPNGLWFKIYHPKISAMYEDLKHGVNIHSKYTAKEERAVLRYIEELVFTTVNSHPQVNI